MASPKYLVGESYGGFRAAKVARVLQHDQGIVVSGVVMLSPLIEGGYVFGGGDRHSLGCALQLPSIVAAELQRKGAFTPQAIAEAEVFARTEYLATLAGPAPKGEEKGWPQPALDKVVELRVTRKMGIHSVAQHEEVVGQVKDLADRVEVLPDRVLLYADDG